MEKYLNLKSKEIDRISINRVEFIYSDTKVKIYYRKFIKSLFPFKIEKEIVIYDPITEGKIRLYDVSDVDPEFYTKTRYLGRTLFRLKKSEDGNLIAICPIYCRVHFNNGNLSYEDYIFESNDELNKFIEDLKFREIINNSFLNSKSLEWL